MKDSDESDEALRARFQEARQTEERDTPPFQPMWNAARSHVEARGRRRRKTALVGGVLAVAAGAATAVGGFSFRGREQVSIVAETAAPRVALEALTEQRAPLASVSSVASSPSAGSPTTEGADPIGDKLFPPELILAHQQDLALDENQRKKILAEAEAVQRQAPSIQSQMQATTEQMTKLLGAPKLDEAAILAEAEKVMNLERDMKKLHLTMLVRLKNLLTLGQQAKLSELRKRGR